MGALYGIGIDNAFIEIDSDEVPIMDGSAKLFVNKINEVGLKFSDQPIKIIKINQKIKFQDGEKFISIDKSFLLIPGTANWKLNESSVSDMSTLGEKSLFISLLKKLSKKLSNNNGLT